MFSFPKFIPSTQPTEIKSYWLCIYSNESESNYGHLKPYIRPCSLTRAQILDIEKNRKGSYVLEGSCYTFSDLDENLTVSEIILRATILGVIIDFIEIDDLTTDYKHTIQDIIDVQTSSSLFTGNKVDISTL